MFDWIVIIKEFFIYLRKRKIVNYIEEYICNTSEKFFVIYYLDGREEIVFRTPDRKYPKWIDLYIKKCGSPFSDFSRPDFLYNNIIFWSINKGVK